MKSHARVFDDAITPATLARRALDVAARERRRIVIGIAGIPGSGKSTVASLILQQLLGTQQHCAALVPMDGFHLRNDLLAARGLSDRKGCPETFDADSYIRLLSLARQAGASMYFPVYDRALHESALHEDPHQRIFPETRIILTEGNYLLLDAEPWRRLSDVLDEGWLLETKITDARRWLMDRHIRGGKPREQAERHYHKVDLANTNLVLQHMRKPHLRLVRQHAIIPPHENHRAPDRKSSRWLSSRCFRWCF